MSLRTESSGSILLGPALSPGNQFLAIIVPDNKLEIVSIKYGAVIESIELPSTIRSCVPDLQILKWAPETELVNETGTDGPAACLRAWILLAGGNRLIVVQLTMSSEHESRRTSQTIDLQVIADYSLETQNGKVVVADFVFNHKQALVTFDMNTLASVISFVKPERDDILSPKYRNRQGFVQSTKQQYFALMLRSKGQDQIAVFTCTDDRLCETSTFAPGTVDAQGMKWAPNDDPLLAVWESATYGSLIRFFTASGHPLKQLDLQHNDIFSDAKLLSMVSGIGISCLSWTASGSGDTLLAFGCGDHQLVLCKQDARSMRTFPAFSYAHRAIVDGAQSHSWQQTSADEFELLSTVFEVHLEPSAEIDLIEVNVDASLIATRLTTIANTLWIWNRDAENPVALVVFQKNIGRALWHPLLKNVLVVITHETTPSTYIWYDLFKPPKKVTTSFGTTFLPGRWMVQWAKIPGARRCPLLLSSTKHFDVGLLSCSDDEVVFESLLEDRNDATLLDEESSLFDTPSRRPTVHPSTIDPDFDDLAGWWNMTPSGSEW